MKLGIMIGALIGLLGIIGYVNFADGAVDMFIKIDSIPGESTDSKHDKWIDVLSVSWGATNPVFSSTGAGGTRETSNAVVADFSFIKEADKSSPKLFLAVANGENLRDVTIDLVKRTGSESAGVPFIKGTLTDAIVTSYSISSSGETPTEHISLNFAKVEYQHTLQDSKTGNVETKVSYDLTTGKVG